MDSFFTLSKIGWTLLQPDHLLLLLLILATLLISFRVRLGVKLLWLVVICLSIVAVMPVGKYLLMPLETRFSRPAELPQQIGGIIVLGGAELAEQSEIWQQAQFNSAAERVMELVPLLRHYPDVPVIYSGGSGSLLKPEYRGADTAQQWLQRAGLSERIMLERESRNTWQNARESLYLLNETPQQPWLLVTSAYHMPRAMGVFRAHQWPVIAWPVDYNSSQLEYRPGLWANLRDLVMATREWVGLAVYHMTAKTEQWFPGPETE